MITAGLMISLHTSAITLEECYNLSRSNYPMVAQYELIEKAKEYSLSNAEKAYLPQISFLGQASYQNAVSSFPQQMESTYEKMGINFKGLSKDQYKLMLQATQTIWDGGTTKAQKASIKEKNKIEQLSIDKEINAIKNRVNQLYFGILIMEANKKINEETDSLIAQNEKILESGIKNGVNLKTDKDNIEVERLTLKLKQEQIKSTITAYRQILSLIIGKEIGETEILEKPETIGEYEENARTEMKLFDAEKEQVETERYKLKASLMPRLEIYAQGWYGKPGLNMFDDMMNNEFSWNGIVGLRLQWNLSGFYTRKNNMEQISLSEQKIETERKLFDWNLNQQKKQFKTQIETMEEMQQTDSSIVQFRHNIRLSAESKYRNGVITINDLLRDLTNEKEAKQTQRLHELEKLEDLYELKATLNQ